MGKSKDCTVLRGTASLARWGELLSLIVALTLVPAVSLPAAEETETAAAVPADEAAETAASVPADDEAAMAVGEEFSAALELGYRYADTKDDRSFVEPYDPLESSPVFGFDLLHLKPGLGTFNLEAGFLHENDWNVRADYNKGAAVAVGGRWEEFTHALEHKGLPVHAVSPLEIAPEDLDPEDTYSSNFQDRRAHLKVRAPNYPAHIRADARIYTREGPSQMIYYDRSCSTHECHIVSRTRDLDQTTQEFNVGFDSHLGPVDVAYNRNMLTFKDEASDPLDEYGGLVYPAYGANRPAGLHEHDVNPDIASYSDTLKLNTNLTNRVGATLTYVRGESENDESDVTRRQQRIAADLRYTFSSRAHLFFRYRHDQEDTADISDATLADRLKVGHPGEPERTLDSGEVVLRLRPGSRWDLHAHIRHTALEHPVYTSQDRIDNMTAGTDVADLTDTTRTTEAELRGEYRPAPALELQAAFGIEDTADPAFPSDTTRKYTYSLGAIWTPSPLFTFQTLYSGYTGENDDADALQSAYYKLGAFNDTFKREVDGHHLTALAALVPNDDLIFTAAYTYSRNGVDQDLLIGTPSYSTLVYEALGSPWEQMSQVVNLSAAWSPMEQLTLNAGGMLITGEETWEPAFPQNAGIADLAAVEFTKLLASLGAEIDVTRTMSVSIEGFWADFDDKENDDRDGSGAGAIASLAVKW